MRNDFKLDRYRCSITPISPIFIGSSEEYSPTEYIVESGVLYHFNPTLVPLTPGLSKKLLEASNSDSIASVPAFLVENKDRYIPFADHAVEVGASTERSYRQMVLGRDTKNQNFILRSAYCSKPGSASSPYIPGSGLKGVIRTALLDRLSGSRIQEKNFENDLLGGDFASSPLRFLKVGDFLPRRIVKTRVDECKRSAKTPRDNANSNPSIPKRCEFVLQAQYRSFEGEVVLQNRIESCVPGKTAYESIDQIVRDLNRFYRRRFEADALAPLWQGASIAGQPWVQACRRLLGQLEPEMHAGRIALIRIGGNVGAESVTLRNGSAKIRNRKTGEDMQEATTAWGACVGTDFLPFGWAILEIAPRDENEALLKWCKQFAPTARSSQELTAALAPRKEAILNAFAAELELKRQEEEQRRQAELAEQEKEKQLASLPHNLRIVSELAEEMNKQTSINPGTDLYNKVCRVLEAASEWPVQERKSCADQLRPLMKKKNMYQGKKAKELKQILASLSQES